MAFPTSRAAVRHKLCSACPIKASACLRDDTLTHSLVFLMWGYLGFHGQEVGSLTSSSLGPAEDAEQRSVSRFVPLLGFMSLTSILSLPAVLYQVSRSVPGILHGFQVVALMSASIGVLQGLGIQFGCCLSQICGSGVGENEEASEAGRAQGQGVGPSLKKNGGEGSERRRRKRQWWWDMGREDVCSFLSEAKIPN